jgi:hypothetical protein
MNMPTTAWGRGVLLALMVLTVTPAATAQTKKIYFDGTGPLTLQQTIEAELTAGEDDLNVYLKAPASGTQTYTGPLSLAASEATIRIIGGYDTETRPLPDAIVLQGSSSTPNDCFGNVLRDPSFEGASNGTVSPAWTFSQPTLAVFTPTEAFANVINPVAEGFATLTPDVIDGRRAVLVQNSATQNTLDATFSQVFRTPAGVPQPYELRFGAFANAVEAAAPPVQVSIEFSASIPVPPLVVSVPVNATYNDVPPIIIPALPANEVVTFRVRVQVNTIAANAQTKIVLDAFCLKPQVPAPAAPAIDLARPAADESITVLLENFTISGGSYGVQAGAGVNLTVNRCYFTGSPVGVRVNQAVAEGSVLVGHSVFANTGIGVRVDQGSAAIFQSTFRGNGTGVQVNALVPSVSYLVASLFAENNTDVTAGGGGALRTAGNMFLSTYETGPATEPAGTTPETNLGARPVPSAITDISSELFLNNAWNGKLQVDAGKILLAGFAFFDLPQVVQGRILAVAGDTDFEGGLRDLNELEVGADETDSPAQAPWYWQDVSLAYGDGSLPNTAGGLPPAVGKNRALGITITLTGRDTSEIQNVYVVPELLLADGPADPALRVRAAALDWGGPGVKALEQSTATYTDTITLSVRPEDTGVTGLQAVVDGLATILIELDDTLYGLGFDTENVSGNAQANSRFIIDTIEPVIGEVNLSAANLITSSNDVTSAPVSSTAYPAQWAPQYGTVPASYGTIDDRYRDPQAFFNLPISATNGLDFAVEVPFIDLPPSSPDFTVNVTTSGFDPAYGDSGLALDVLFGPDDNSAQPDGTARWLGPRATIELGAATATAGAFMSQGNAAAAFQWSVSDVINVLGPNGWRIQSRIVARDRAGNQATSARPLILWWLTDARAQITSAPNGPVTSPTIVWNLARDVSPQNSEACSPIVRFKLWRAIDPGVPFPDWAELSGWSDWTARPAISASTRLFVDSPLRLGDILANVPVGERIGISIMGADEAGNIEGSPNAGVYSATEFNEADLVPGEPLSFVSWETGEAPSALDTRVQARFWHNRTDNNLLRSIEPETEIDFGSNPRIPLPAAPDDPIRVEASFEVDISNGGGFLWELYEDGRLAASGRKETPEGTGTIQFPQDLQAPSAGIDIVVFNNFLNNPCYSQPSPDRLGDDGCDDGNFRRRDVKYTFVARAYAPGSNEDPSPATINFTVYIDQPGEDDQPVKESSRGGN